MVFDDYDYLLPKKNLALEPADPRDHSKLFVYNTKKDSISFDYFYNLDHYLPNDSFLILNHTKVLPARVTMKKQSGGKVVTLFLVNEIKNNVVPVIVDRKIMVGEKIYFDDRFFLTIIAQRENIFYLEISCLPADRKFSRQTLFSLLKKNGSMPIPPYLKKTSLSRDQLLKKYQTIFAKREGSAAAPTASLHFTDKVFDKIEKKRIEKYFITLHVGLGTFTPITEDNIKQKKLHEEYFQIDSSTFQSINKLKQEGRQLVAVGTTVTRTLESISNVKDKTFGETDLFIFPPYNFKMVDVLLTNFHLPKSSLMMLVAAFLQHKTAKKSLVELYNIAIKNGFRFYSFGDSMLIL